MPQEYLDRLTAVGREEMWRRLLSREWSAEAFMVVDGDEPVGFVAVDQSADADATPKTGAVNSIYVRARVWDTGVGRLLMGCGLGALRARGCDAATLWVLDTNARARRFYEAGGWSVDGSRVEEIGGVTVSEVRYRISLPS